MSTDELATFVIVNDDGYPALQHFPGDDTDNGCHVMFVDADNLETLVSAASKHTCGAPAQPGEDTTP